MRLFQSNENEGIDSPTTRNNEAKMPHCKIYNPLMELTTVRARKRAMYLRYTSSNRPTKTRRARQPSARMRRETREEGIDTETMPEGKKETRVAL